MDNNTKLFLNESGEEMSMSDLFGDIYKNSKDKSKEIQAAIVTVMSKVNDINDVTMLMPLVRDLYEISVRNDDSLIKMSATLQRYISSKQKVDTLENQTNDYFGLSEEEKKQLIENALNKIEEPDYKVLETRINNTMKELEENNE